MATFSNKDEEIVFWKRKYEEMVKELEEFRETSQMIEKELEMSVDQAEHQVRDLRTKSNRLQFENDNLRGKLSQISELQNEVTASRARETSYRKYIRELEQKNDDLERAQRAMYASLEDFETKLNASIEKNALLESELDERESLNVVNQRLKDEIRDLKQEIQVIQSKGRKTSISPQDSNKSIHETTQPLLSPASVKNPNPRQIPNPSVRLTHMDIVGDLLRKVGSLEAKLASCRNNNGETYSKPRRTSISSPTIHNLGRQ